MSSKPKILVVREPLAQKHRELPAWSDAFDTEEVDSPLRALARLARDEFAGVYVSSAHLSEAFRIGKLLQNERILEGMPDGIVLLDSDNTIIGATAGE